jgi:putative transposase
MPERKHPPHLTLLERKAVILLLTVCTKNRRKILGHEWVHQLIRRSWNLCGDYSVGRYVIMPEHIHAFVGEGSLARYRLENWVAAWKSFVSRRWPDVYEKPFGSEAFGIAKSEAVTSMIRNGFMCGTIRFVMAW